MSKLTLKGLAQGIRERTGQPISPQALCKKTKDGMPVDSVDACLDWLVKNVHGWSDKVKSGKEAVIAESKPAPGLPYKGKPTAALEEVDITKDANYQPEVLPPNPTDLDYMTLTWKATSNMVIRYRLMGDMRKHDSAIVSLNKARTSLDEAKKAHALLQKSTGALVPLDDSVELINTALSPVIQGLSTLTSAVISDILKESPSDKLTAALEESLLKHINMITENAKAGIAEAEARLEKVQAI